MSKISGLPVLDEAEINGSERVPVVRDGQTWQAEISYLAAEAAKRAEFAAATAFGLSNFRPTFAEAIADFEIGTVFTTDENGVLEAYIRIKSAPGYVRNLALDPATRLDVENRLKSADLNSPEPDKGAALVGFGNTNVYARLASEVFLTDYIHLADLSTNDWTPAIVAAEEAAFSKGKALRIPPGSYGYSNNITFRCEVLGSGFNSTRLLKFAPATITFQSGVFSDVMIASEKLIPGDTTDGLILNTTARKYVHVWCEYHGGDGVRYERGNLSRIIVHSRFNAGRGVFCPLEPVSPGDNKVCNWWVEATGNGLSGYEIEQGDTQAQVGSAHSGVIIAQGNGTRQVADNDYNVILTGVGHNFTNVYAESGQKSAWHRSGLKASRIFYSNISHSTFLDEADDSNEVSYVPSALGSRLTIASRLKKLVLAGVETLIGRLELMQTADRVFLLDALGSGAAQTLALGSSLSITKSGLPMGLKVTSGSTLDFGTVAAGATVDRIVPIAALSAPLPPHVAVSASPRFAISPGIVWSAFLTGGTEPVSDPAVVTVRCANVTGNDIPVSGPFNISFVV